MHNGEVSGFDKFKRKLQTSLNDEIFSVVKGNTGMFLQPPNLS